jgi:hypothetical protein
MVVREGVPVDVQEWQQEFRGLTEEMRERASTGEKEREKGKTGGESERHSFQQRERVRERV